jgi:hypothetical protein
MLVNDSDSPQQRDMWQWQAGGKAGVLAYPRGLFYVASRSCRTQRQCSILVSCRQEIAVLEVAPDRDGAWLACKLKIDAASREQELTETGQFGRWMSKR